MPFVRSIIAQWQPRNCDPMVDFLDSWAPLIPVWVLDNILEQLIFPSCRRRWASGVGSREPGSSGLQWLSRQLQQPQSRSLKPPL